MGRVGSRSSACVVVKIMGIFPPHIPVVSNFLRRLPRSAAKEGFGIDSAAVCSAKANGRILNSDRSGRISMLPRRGGRPSGVRLVSVLSELKVGETGVVETLELPESVQNYLMHLGFLPEAHVTVLRRAPAGDPTVYGVDGMEIALRHETASSIRIHQVDEHTASASAPEAGADEADSKLPAPHGIAASIELNSIELNSIQLNSINLIGAAR